MTWFGWVLVIFILTATVANIFTIGDVQTITKGRAAFVTVVNLLIILGLITVGV